MSHLKYGSDIEIDTTSLNGAFDSSDNTAQKAVESIDASVQLNTRTISVAASGGDYTTISDAIDSLPSVIAADVTIELDGTLETPASFTGNFDVNRRCTNSASIIITSAEVTKSNVISSELTNTDTTGHNDYVTVLKGTVPTWSAGWLDGALIVFTGGPAGSPNAVCGRSALVSAGITECNATGAAGTTHWKIPFSALAVNCNTSTTFVICGCTLIESTSDGIIGSNGNVVFDYIGSKSNILQNGARITISDCCIGQALVNSVNAQGDKGSLNIVDGYVTAGTSTAAMVMRSGSVLIENGKIVASNNVGISMRNNYTYIDGTEIVSLSGAGGSAVVAGYMSNVHLIAATLTGETQLTAGDLARILYSLAGCPGATGNTTGGGITQSY